MEGIPRNFLSSKYNYLCDVRNNGMMRTIGINDTAGH